MYSFSLGEEITYLSKWYFFDTYPYVAPKYSNIKDEFLLNDIDAMPDDTYLKFCTTLYQSFVVKMVYQLKISIRNQNYEQD